ncbi:sensor histidine kinase [Granulosicoccus antarcticus]|uniref:histidine kinase n=1 Tax=Granulosicoccus antarcticus IMCC3135 TaxID=1192854 RepID=A0A2Z2NR02_9GAMM|nr:ATP-binding protein [Granulosicoccus antarcticus]ASJ71160.1 Sensor protein CzcS [Granulosicoccus antarcticus IMCC3135]
MAINPDNVGFLSGNNCLKGSCVGRGITSPEEVQTAAVAAPESLNQKIRKRLFDRFHALRNSAFRIAVLFWLLFTVCFGLGSYFVYQTLQDRVLDRIDQTIEERFSETRDIYESEGIEAIIRIAEHRNEQSPMSSLMGFHLSTAEGVRIAGNIPLCLANQGWDNLTGADLGLENDNSTYRFFTGEIGGNVLSLGRNLDDLVDLRQIALSCLLWTTVISMLLAFLVACYFAGRANKRYTGISRALDVVGQGDLSARLPVGCAKDDVDCLSVKVNTSLERLEHTVNGMRQVSTDIAHDLKTPLNRLYITIEDAATKSRLGQCVGDDLEGALEEAQAINGTFEALLRIAQIEAGARRSQFKHFDLSTVLETAAEVYGPVVDEQGQQLVVDLRPGQSLPMLGDRHLGLQLVVNLIENAVNHCAENTVITLSAGEDDGIVWFRVADSGLGIPDSEREKVFQRLYRLERSRTTTGTGLGLSLVKAIADLHCGTVSLADNKPGLAVTVRFDRNCPLDAAV